MPGWLKTEPYWQRLGDRKGYGLISEQSKLFVFLLQYWQTKAQRLDWTQIPCTGILQEKDRIALDLFMVDMAKRVSASPLHEVAVKFFTVRKTAGQHSADIEGNYASIVNMFCTA